MLGFFTFFHCQIEAAVWCNLFGNTWHAVAICMPLSMAIYNDNSSWNLKCDVTWNSFLCLAISMIHNKIHHWNNVLKTWNFLQNVPSECTNAISGIQILKNFRGSMPPDPPRSLVPLALPTPPKFLQSFHHWEEYLLNVFTSTLLNVKLL